MFTYIKNMRKLVSDSKSNASKNKKQVKRKIDLLRKPRKARLRNLNRSDVELEKILDEFC